MKPTVNDYVEFEGEILKVLSIDVYSGEGKPAIITAVRDDLRGAELRNAIQKRINVDRITRTISRRTVKKWRQAA
jgi:hypothetical protein